MILDVALLLIAFSAYLFRRSRESRILVLFWLSSMILFEAFGDLFQWFMIYASLCTVFAVFSRSVLVIYGYVFQQLACFVVVCEWETASVYYDKYELIIGACFLIQVLGVSIAYNNGDSRCTNNTNNDSNITICNRVN